MVNNPFQEFGGQLINNDPFVEFGGQQTGPPIKKMQQDATRSVHQINNNLPDNQTQQFLDYYKKKDSKEGADAFNSLRYENNNPSVKMTNDRSNYNPFTNTLNVDTSDYRGIQDNSLAELAHAQQFKNNLIGNYAKLLKDRLFIGSDKSYSTKGTIENEAHSIIEPKLRTQYQNRVIDYYK